jgi:GH24 family phage-related lysozyme (muramidase)
VHISEVGQNLIKTFEGATLSKNIVKDLEEKVSNLITAPINQNQFDALFSFASNMGVTVLENSFLLKRINSLEDPCEVAKEELHKWNKESGQIFQALSRRRAAELDLFCHKPPDFKWGWVSITSKAIGIHGESRCCTEPEYSPLPSYRKIRWTYIFRIRIWFR